MTRGRKAVLNAVAVLAVAFLTPLQPARAAGSVVEVGSAVATESAAVAAPLALKSSCTAAAATSVAMPDPFYDPILCDIAWGLFYAAWALYITAADNERVERQEMNNCWAYADANSLDRHETCAEQEASWEDAYNDMYWSEVNVFLALFNIQISCNESGGWT